jgi:hypothetical protein
MSALLDVGLSEAASMSLADPVFFAIFKKVYRFSRADVDEKTFVEVSEPSLNLATRDGKFMETLTIGSRLTDCDRKASTSIQTS